MTHPDVVAYENDLARRLDVRHVVATSSGTTAIHTALHAAGVRPGHDVLVPALSVVMTAAPIVHLGARPVVVDSTPDGTSLDLDDLTRKAGPHAHAIVPVLLWGRADPHATHLAEFARTRGLRVIVDACPAIGTTSADQQTGLGSTATCFSTHATKLLATGEGGFIVTDDDELAEYARAYRSHWLPAPPDHPGRPAHNFRLAGPLAALGRRELGHLDALVRRRRELTALLAELLADSPHMTALDAPDGWNGYSPLLRLTLPRAREFCDRLAGQGIPNSTGTFGLIPLDQRPAFRDNAQPLCPTAATVLDTTLAVALDTGTDQELIQRYATTISQEADRWADA